MLYRADDTEASHGDYLQQQVAMETEKSRYAAEIDARPTMRVVVTKVNNGFIITTDKTEMKSSMIGYGGFSPEAVVTLDLKTAASVLTKFFSE